MTIDEWIRSGPLLGPIWQELKMEEREDTGHSEPMEVRVLPGNTVSRGGVIVKNIGTEPADLELRLGGE